MRIGVLSVYSFRPHVEQMVYLAQLLEERGHEISYFTCDAALSDCHNRMFKNQSRLKSCTICVAGGLRSYGVGPIDSVSKKLSAPLDPTVLTQIAQSSAFTIHRAETKADIETPEFRESQEALERSTAVFYANVKDWIERRKLDAVFVFNGRMDLTRATTYACETSGIPFVTVERPWMGHGMHITINDNCISIKDFLNLGIEFKDKPLTETQAQEAGRLVSNRFRRQDLLDWRVYNTGTHSVTWPIKGKPSMKILVLPGSRSEFWGHPDWDFEFGGDTTVGLDRLIETIGGDFSNVVLRCHPIWAEYFGTRLGDKSERHYTQWAKKRGGFVYSPREKVDSFSLMSEADVIITTGGTAGVEAASLGKPVLNIGPSRYETMGLAYHMRTTAQMKSLAEMTKQAPQERVRQALRYFYMHAARQPMFVHNVRCTSPTQYRYFKGADIDRILSRLETGLIPADDATFAAGPNAAAAESAVVGAILASDWKSLSSFQPTVPSLEPMEIRRRAGLRWVDEARKLFPTGDSLHKKKAPKLVAPTKS